MKKELLKQPEVVSRSSDFGGTERLFAGRRVLCVLLLPAAMLLTILCWHLHAGEADVLKHASIPKGIACIPECSDINEAMGLVENGWMVLALHEDENQVATDKRKASATGQLGRRLYIQQGSLDKIPFADNYVDLLVLSHRKKAGLKTEHHQEIMRVLTPVLGRAVLADTVIEKPELPGSDWWTHSKHGANNNQVSKDTAFQFPPVTQYRAVPFFNPLMGDSLADDGIMVEIMDWYAKGGTARAMLSGAILGRNHYNGCIIWESTLPEEMVLTLPIAALGDGQLFVATGGDGGVSRWELKTGRQLPRLKLGKPEQRGTWLAYDKGRLHVLLADEYSVNRGHFIGYFTYDQWDENETFGSTLVTWELTNEKEAWRHREEKLIDNVNVAVHEGRLYFYVDGVKLVSLDAATGKQIWANTDGNWIEKLKRQKMKHLPYNSLVSHMAVAEGMVRVSAANRDGNNSAFFDLTDGRFLSETQATKYDLIRKGVFLDGKYYKPNLVYDPRSKEESKDNLLPTQTGTSHCGTMIYAPGAGMLGHSSLGYKAPCAVGARVAGGLLTYPASVCDCSLMVGTGGLASGGELLKQAKTAAEYPLVTGPAGSATSTIIPGKTWAGHRAGTGCHGSVPCLVAKPKKQAWRCLAPSPYPFNVQYGRYSLDFEDRVVPAVASGDTCVIAGSDGQVRAHALTDGTLRWKFEPDGGVWTSPTLTADSLYFGAADGWVYCLRLTDGALRWKRRLAPLARSIHIFDHIMNTWPVLGVTLHKGRIYAAAGMQYHNGVQVAALNATDGSVVWNRYIAAPEKSFPCAHHAPDIPHQGVSGAPTIINERLWVAGHFSLPLCLDIKDGSDHLVEQKKLLTSTAEKMVNLVTWAQFSNQAGQDVIQLGPEHVLVGGQPLFEEHQVRDGKIKRTAYRLFTINEQGDWNWKLTPTRMLSTTRISPALDTDLFVCVTSPEMLTNKLIANQAKVGNAMYGVHAWSSNAIIEAAGNLRPVQPLQISEKNGKQVIEYNRQSHKSLSVVGAADKWSKPELHVNALALGKDAVLVAHALDPKRSGNKRQGATLAVNGWCVTAFDRENGRELWKHNLPIEPLINGLTIADDETILVTLRDGSIVCLN